MFAVFPVQIDFRMLFQYGLPYFSYRRQQSTGLAGKIPGMIDIKVYIDGLSSSNTDLMLDSSFEDEASLQGYAVHPAHVEVATNQVRPYTKIRSCFDFDV